MRQLIFAAALLLTGCWVGVGLYSNKDARQPIPAGLYRATNGEEQARIEKVTLLSNGLTKIGDGDGDGLYGFAPLDKENRRFVVWYRKDDGTADDHAQLYLLLERRSGGEFVLFFPACKDELAELARKAGATIEAGTLDTCQFPTRASLESAMRQVQVSQDVIKITPIHVK